MLRKKLFDWVNVRTASLNSMFSNKTKKNRKTSSPKGNDRSPDSKQVFLNSSQVSKIFFSIGQGQLTPQSMVGPNSDVNQES